MLQNTTNSTNATIPTVVIAPDIVHAFTVQPNYLGGTDTTFEDVQAIVTDGGFVSSFNT